MRAIVISNGCIENYDFYKDMFQINDFVICADGGAIHALKMGIVPQMLIGDLDSIDPSVKEVMIQKKVKLKTFSSDKDETDTQLAVEYALAQGCNEILMIGSLGSRVDHSFANISLLKTILDQGARGKILNEYNEVYLIEDEISIEGRRGNTISLLPISMQVTGITTTGLKYVLRKATMKFGNPYGISNVFEECYVKIAIESGLLLVVKAND